MNLFVNIEFHRMLWYNVANNKDWRLSYENAKENDI